MISLASYTERIASCPVSVVRTREVVIELSEEWPVNFKHDSPFPLATTILESLKSRLAGLGAVGLTRFFNLKSGR